MSDNTESGPAPIHRIPLDNPPNGKPRRGSRNVKSSGRILGLFTGFEAPPEKPDISPPAAIQSNLAGPQGEPCPPVSIEHAGIWYEDGNKSSPPAGETPQEPEPYSPVSIIPGIRSSNDTAAPSVNPKSDATAQPNEIVYTLPGAQGLAVARSIEHTDGGVDIEPAGNRSITPLVWESLRVGKPLAEMQNNEQAAVLAFGRPLPVGGLNPGAAPALLLEVMDDNPDREWTEDELLLVEQVTDQLTLALENARLFEEARRRNEELTTLNRITSAISTMMDLDQVLGEVLNSVIQAIGFDGGLVSMVDVDTQRLSLAAHTHLPEVMVNGLKTNGFDATLCDLVYQDAKTLYLPELSHTDKGPSSSYPRPEALRTAARKALQAGFASYVGVPLVSKGTCMGTVCAFSNDVQEITPARIHMLEAISQQVGVVIENVSLFEQTQRTRDALQVSERYQKGIAQAVAALTERGIAALSEVLELLGQASQAGRVHYLETQVDPNGPYWRLLTEWRSDGISSSLSNPQLRHLALKTSTAWVERLRTQGFVQINLLESDEAFDGDILQVLGAQSVLIFSVSGRHELPGSIIFEQTDHQRQWQDDEIAALQTAAAALSNTIAREDLFTQVQANLAETEAQYQASSRLNSATTFSEILTVLRRYTILGHLNTACVTLNLFDRPWRRDARAEWLQPVATWQSGRDVVSNQADTDQSAAVIRHPLLDWKTADLLLDAERPTIVVDTTNDPRLDDTIRDLYVHPHGARSLLFVPLNVSGRWIGHIVGIYRQSTGFPEPELRRMTSLAGQAAVALEGLRLVSELQQRARQLQTAAEIARDTTSTLSLDALLARSANLLHDRFGYEHVSIFLITEHGNEAVVAEAAGLAADEMKRRDYRLAVGGRSVVGQASASGEAMVITGTEEDEEQNRFLHNPLLPQTRSELALPLKIGDRVIGVVDVQSNQINAFSEDDQAVLQTLADQVAVAVDNAQAYALTQKAVEEIREADRLKTQFLANMSHELRTPLNSIIGFSRVILKGIDGPINDQQNQDLTAIYNSGQHLLGLINDVLDLSRIEAGKMDLAFDENVNLGDIIKSVMSTTAGLVKDKPIELRQRIAPDLPPVTIDPMKIRQVLINLLSNAAKFTDEGSITVESEPRIASGGRAEVIVRVIDTGPGIALADQAKLFQPFSQVDGSLTRKTGGSGLGLSICQHLIRMHGGQIGLESKVGKGTTFFFTLPVTHRSDDTDPDEPPISTVMKNDTTTGIPDLAILQPQIVDDSPVASDYSLSPDDQDAPESQSNAGEIQAEYGLLLAVDRDPQVTELYRRYLDGYQATVISLAELEQVLTVARSIQPKVITLDVGMQGWIGGRNHPSNPVTPGDPFYIDGWQVLQNLKNDPSTQNIPVIVCSLVNDPNRAAKLGADAYLLKPILEDDLIQALNQVRKAQ